jgi:hypothetical protein
MKRTEDLLSVDTDFSATPFNSDFVASGLR